MKKVIKKILAIFLIGLLLPLLLVVCLSCCYHHLGGSKSTLVISNEKQQSASVVMRLYREHPWYRYLLNPVGLSYHPYYLAEQSLVEGKIALEHIHDGDMLRIYVRRDVLPLQFTFQGEGAKPFLINWELIGQELDKIWEYECQLERECEHKFFSRMNPQSAGIALIWQRKDGQWHFLRASWVAKDRQTLQKLDREAEILSQRITKE